MTNITIRVYCMALCNFPENLERNPVNLVCNVGFLDRCIRIIFGAALIYIGLIDTSLVKTPEIRIAFSVIGVSSLLVGILRFCPLYTLLDIDTRHTDAKPVTQRHP